MKLLHLNQIISRYICKKKVFLHLGVQEVQGVQGVQDDSIYRLFERLRHSSCTPLTPCTPYYSLQVFISPSPSGYCAGRCPLADG